MINLKFSAICTGLLLAAACSDDPADSSMGNLGATSPMSTAAGTTAANPPGNTPGNQSTAGSQAGAMAQAASGGAAAPVAGMGANPGGAAAAAAGGSGEPAAGSGGEGGSQNPSTPSGPSEWTMMGYDHASTYFNANETVLTKENAANLEVAWRADMGTNVYGAPLQVGDTIYASSGARVTAFKADSGDELWRASATTTGSMAYDDGSLYLNALSGGILALDASDGSRRWSASPDRQSDDGSSSPIIAGDLLLVGGASGGAEVLGSSTFRGYVAALNKGSGDVEWVAYTVMEGAYGAAVWSTVAVDMAANQVYAATGNNHRAPATDSSDAIIAIDLTSGDIQWKNQRTAGDTWSFSDREKPDADFGANPIAYQAMLDGSMTQLVAAGQKSGDAHAVRRDNGELVWTRSLCPGGLRDGRDGIFVNGAWTGSHLLFACNNNLKSELFAVDGATGDIAWQTSLPAGEVYGRISVANGVGFVGSGPELVIVDVDNGEIIKTVPSQGGTVAGTITIANGRVAYGEGLSWSNGLRGSTLTVLAVP